MVDKYIFDEDEHGEKSAGCSQKLSSMGKFIWNSNTSEFCGRDGMSWGKYFLRKIKKIK